MERHKNVPSTVPFFPFFSRFTCHPLVKTMLLLPLPEALPQLFLIPPGQTWLQLILKPLMAPLSEELPLLLGAVVATSRIVATTVKLM